MPYPRSPLFAALALALAIAAGAVSVSGIPSPALSLGWYPDGACDDAAAQNPGDPAGCRYLARERDCGNALDDDSDERADCADPDCAATDGCRASCVPAEEVCGDGVDQDCDGADAPCCPWWNPLCAAEVCGNGADDDGDGFVDCADPDCTTSERCLGAESSCADGQDNDADGNVDCNDSDCAAEPACAGRRCLPSSSTEDCSLEGDEECDGLADAADSDCAGFCRIGWWPFWLPPCPEPENCGNDVDDDGDGVADCDDPDCSTFAGCVVGSEICDNVVDDDSDGAIDCADGDCSADPFCGGCTGTFCECNPSDPSCQGNVCGDRSCSGDEDCASCAADCGECPPRYEICGDKADNDGDGNIDCADQDCSGNCECSGGCTEFCDDVSACNYGQEGACEFCACDGLDNDLDSEIDEAGESCQVEADCFVVAVSGVNANSDFVNAVKAEIAKSQMKTSFISMGGTENADDTAAAVENRLKAFYANSNERERILVAAHSLGAIAVFNMQKTYGGSYPDTSFLLYDPPYNYPGSDNPMRWFSGTLRAIKRARDANIAGSITANWTGGLDQPNDPQEQADHVKFVSAGSGVLVGIKDWVDGCPRE